MDANDKAPKTLAVVVPCYNEEEAFPVTARRLGGEVERLAGLGLVSSASKVVFVDDGSSDATWDLIRERHEANRTLYGGIKLTRNQGHQNALLAGLMTVRGWCDMAVSIDADLQDDVSAVEAMVRSHLEGCEIVYGVRSSRRTDSVLKRSTALGFYSVMRALDADIVRNHADFRLMGKRSLDALAEYGEVNLFLRGIVPMLGYESGVVTYARAKRTAGKSKYPFRKMVNFSLQGITSLTVKPVRMIAWLGFLVSLASIAMVAFFVVQRFTGRTVTGWASTIVSIWAIGGLILLGIGVVGEYIGKIYLETKRRPRYRVEQVLDGD